jgi:hypothetical protein
VDDGLGHERYRTSIVFNYVFSGVPAICGKYRMAARWQQSRVFELCTLRIFTVDDLLRDRRKDIFTPFALRARSDVGFAVPPRGRKELYWQRSLGPFLGGWIFDALFFSLSMAGRSRVSAN